MREDLTGQPSDESLGPMIYSMLIFGVSALSFAHGVAPFLLFVIFAHFLAVFSILALINIPYFVGRLLDSRENHGRIEACEEKTS